MEHQTIIGELSGLVAETYQLWDEEWVGFTWRNYTFEHVQRVRSLADLLAEQEGADRLVLAYAATLHDITKSYDGEIVMKDGQRHLDDSGRWRNQFVAPARRNKVTDLYDRLDLAGLLHSESGAVVAGVLLAEYGVPETLRQQVAGVIRAHLRPGPGASVEQRVLYDADTVDANIGMPAFHRNLYINLHREEAARPDFAEWVGPRRAEFYRWYLGERVPTWIDSRRPEFLSRLTTATGRQVGARRYDRLAEFVGRLVAEIPGRGLNGHGGGLGVLDYLIERRANPRLSEQVEALMLACGDCPDGLARAFTQAMYEEMTGKR
ncbi:MAG: HD domain-containing protein [Chloroflexota bacterium]